MRLWADIDNAPHVPVLKPVIQWLEAHGHEVDITARDYGQAIPLLEMNQMCFRKVGRHRGANKIKKVLSMAARNAALVPFARAGRFSASFSHGSRGPFLACRVNNIPLIQMGDYEHSAVAGFMYRWTSMFLIPDVMPVDGLLSAGVGRSRIRQFPGLKEELYVYDEVPDDSFLDEVGIDRTKTIVLVRPPASMAHYHVASGDRLFQSIVRFLGDRNDIEVILIPRTVDQEKVMRKMLADFRVTNVRIPDRVYPGPSLIYHSDVVLSGGGTMNREAACLGIPVYTIFQGHLGAVDRHLIATGRLRQLTDAAELSRIDFCKREKTDPTQYRERKDRLVDFIGNTILEIAGQLRPNR